MSNHAEMLFSATPRQHNCAQSVAAGCGHEEWVADLASCGGGRAPAGRCGALHAALLLTPADAHEALEKEFTAAAQAATCRAIKSAPTPLPCQECVKLAAALVEKYRN